VVAGWRERACGILVTSPREAATKNDQCAARHGGVNISAAQRAGGHRGIKALAGEGGVGALALGRGGGPGAVEGLACW